MNATTTQRTIDIDEITRTIEIMKGHGQVTELRALNAVSRGDRYRQTWSGYFNDESELATAAQSITSATGIYFTPNVVNPDLLARASNRIRAVKKEPLTSDTDIIRRRWLLIDCDPARPAGISSNDSEHEAALERALQIRDALTAAGWVEAIYADSGNGGHLNYPIDLAADDAGLCERVLKSLSDRFTDDVVKVDLTTFNPARIWKLYGTIVCKGDDTPDRPHRMSRIITAPEVMGLVTQEQLETIASLVQAPVISACTHIAGKSKGGQRFNLDEFVSRHFPEAKSESYKGGRKWAIDCPFDSSHRAPDAAIYEMPDGKAGFKCSHNSCKGRKWQNLREHCEPGCYDRVKAKQNTVPTDRPKIEVGRQLVDVVNDSLAALSQANQPPELFIRGGQISRIATDEDGRRSIVVLTEPALRGALTRAATYFSFGKAGESDSNPPGEVVKDILARDVNEDLRRIGAKPMPRLAAITETPILRPDGSILTEPGYDVATGIVYTPHGGEEIADIPAEPTTHDIEASVDLLREIFCDFPFESESDRSNMLGLLFTPAVRHVVSHAPIASIDAPQLGSGKSLLTDVVATIYTGREASMSSYPETDDEMRKLTTSVLMAGSPIICLDNCDGAIAHPTLARVITASFWQDRLLGTNRTVTLANQATWIATGNNMTFGGDLIRRVYRIRINAASSRPWQGREFKHPNLIEWVQENRNQIVAAILIIIRAWWAAGRPDHGAKRIGSFEKWSTIVGNVLRHAGINGFLDNLEQLYESADDEGPVWEHFLASWHNQYGDSYIPLSRLEDDLPAAAAIRDALPDPFGAFIQRKPAPYPVHGDVYYVSDAGRFKVRLGKALKARIDKRYGGSGYHIQRRDDAHLGSATWCVAIGTPARSGGENAFKAK